MDPLLLLLRSNAETMSRWFHSGDRNQYKLPLLSWKNRRKHQEKMERGVERKTVQMLNENDNLSSTLQIPSDDAETELYGND